MADTFYTIEEIARMLKVSEAKVRQLILAGDLESIRVGRQYRVTQASLDKYVRKAH